VTADVVLYQGSGFQPAIQDAVQETEGVSVDVLQGQALTPAPPGEGELTVDPHVWLDPNRYADIVDEVAGALSKAAPEDAADFRENAAGYERQLDDLDAEYRAGLADCDSRLIVTSHAAFGYLAQSYGLDQEAITGLAPDAEPDPQRIADLRGLVDREGVTTIFTEELASPEVAETLASEAGVSTAVLSPLEGLTDDEIDRGEDYVSVMRANLETLRHALGCR
jgi:zinc transport system substrate-binding protein